MAKKFITLFVVAALAATLTACNGKTDAPTNTDVPKQAASEKKAENDSITYKDFSAKIVNCELSKDDNGDDAVTVTMEFTNKSSEPATFNNYFYETVFQDGVEQSADNFYPGEGYDWDSYYKEIKDGAKITIYTQKPIADPTKPVEVRISSFLSNDSAVKTFELK